MVRDPDSAINVTDSPVVQESEHAGYVEIVWPDKDETTLLHEMEAMNLFADCMRIITDTDPELQP